MKQYYSYEQFRQDTNTLKTMLQPRRYDSIVAISRGGLTLAHALSQGLDVRDVQSVRTELYDGECKRKEISFFGNCCFDNHKKVLVVDDIADSGETLQVVMQRLQSDFSKIVFESATLFYKKTSIYQPTFYINEAMTWIDFFWEVDFVD